MDQMTTYKYPKSIWSLTDAQEQSCHLQENSLINNLLCLEFRPPHLQSFRLQCLSLSTVLIMINKKANGRFPPKVVQVLYRDSVLQHFQVWDDSFFSLYSFWRKWAAPSGHQSTRIGIDRADHADGLWGRRRMVRLHDAWHRVLVRGFHAQRAMWDYRFAPVKLPHSQRVKHLDSRVLRVSRYFISLTIDQESAIMSWWTKGKYF